MGNLINFKSQPSEIRIIYVEEKSSARTFPLLWPDSFAQFVLELYDLFPGTRSLTTTKFLFKDGTDASVCVCSESTFSAIVPKHRQIAPKVDLYYCVLESWLV